MSNTKKRIKHAVRRIMGYNDRGTDNSKPVRVAFVQDKKTGLRTRAYQSYDEYVEHQKSKLPRVLDEVAQHDREYEVIVEQRYRNVQDWRGKSVICVAARLGGEVRAFRSLGALAIGIDLEPGATNPLVLHGDFHNMQFADEVFDFAFCNAIDHAYDLPRLFAEILRVLKPEGQLILEICTEAPSKYESVDLSAGLDFVYEAAEHVGFERLAAEICRNPTSFTNWEGTMATLIKRSPRARLPENG